jgi:predicted DNA-binding transcriptional regulator AlpA
MIKDRMLQINQVAIRFGVGRQAVYNWIRAGKTFDPSKIKLTPGGNMRILESEVNRVIADSPTLKDSLL